MRSSERGNGFLEILLFSPLAFLLLLATIDCGVSLRERSVLRNAIRSGLNAQALAFRDIPIATSSYGLGAKLGKSSESSLPPKFLDSISRETFSSIYQTLAAGSSSTANLKLEGQFVAVSIDPQTGRFISYEALSEVFSYGSGFSLTATLPGVQEQSIEQHLQTVFSTEVQQPCSRFATPLTRQVGSTIEFAAQTQAIVFKVTAAATGFQNSPFRSWFQNMYAVQEFALFPARRQFG